ncbi:MAG: polyprenyl synthetase family protein [Burkholderiales bacterium]|nr:polyprenyl synthetase family protein [Burkholderiales bacterium]
MQKLDTIIRKDLNSEIVLINQIAEYIITSGGKRIRPLLTLLCGRIAGYAEGQLLHEMAAMIEYIHTATLLHDDVVDESGMRRGHKTANAVFGNAASVLVGDFIYTRAFQMMVKSNSLRILDVMATGTNKISEGEVLQLLNIGKSNLTEAEYFAVIKYKTAILFEAAAKVAAISANTSAMVEEHLGNYGLNVGTAFQIVDDILDYTGNSENMGKNVGDDLLEGKITLPLIYLLKNGQAADKAAIVQAIEKPQNADVGFIVQALKNSAAINYCLDLAKRYVAQAIAELDIFNSSIYKTAMIELAQAAINRIN